MYRKVEDYMEKKSFICKNQHGFRKGKGTDTAVMDLIRKLFSDINANNVSSVLFLDYSRAFNTVDHYILLRKMIMYVISNSVCNWFANYFVERIQVTRIGSVVLPGVAIEHGVYQGSPLGPLLFIIYINDLVKILDDTFCNMYADDTVIVSADPCVDTAMRVSYEMFSRIREWCILNRISVSKKKTKHMLVGNKISNAAGKLTE